MVAQVFIVGILFYQIVIDVVISIAYVGILSFWRCLIVIHNVKLLSPTYYNSKHNHGHVLVWEL